MADIDATANPAPPTPPIPINTPLNVTALAKRLGLTRRTIGPALRRPAIASGT